MVKENKPVEFSVVATAVLFVTTVTLLVLAGGLLWWYWGEDLSTEWGVIRQVMTVCFVVWGVSLCVLVLGFIAFHLLIRDKVLGGRSPGTVKKQRTPRPPLKADIISHLRSRYSLYWRHKTRLLLITGDEAAIEQLVPGLQESQWLEGNRTVLIYDGSLTAEPDKEKYAALRKLRRGRPLDGIVRVMPRSLNLTPQISDNDLRGLEKISELLRYSTPVWLWQLCDSKWSQAKRTEQPVGASFPLRAKPDDITRQLELMLPALRTQGVSQVAENNGHDFLLRLGQHLKDGGIARWAQQLVPWLAASQQRVPLRGLMFSLPENKPASTAGETACAAPADVEKYIPESQRHALTLPVTWQGIVDDCTRIRGRRVGMAWEQTMAWLMMARADKVDAVFYAQTLKAVQPTRMGISTGLWQSLSPDLWAFYISGLPTQPEWKIIPDAQLVSQSRHDRWIRSVVASRHTAFDGRFPFAVSKRDASLPMLAEFIRKDSGRIQPSTGFGAAYSGHIVEASSQILFVR